jgi:hypothetical protein
VVDTAGGAGRGRFLDEVTTGERLLPPVADRHPWCTSFALLFTLAALWSVSSPLFSIPDEPEHVVKAAAVARGETGGREVAHGGTEALVTVPEIFELAHVVPACYAFRSQVTADCAPAFVGPRRAAQVTTTAARYPPAYYFVVGLPSLVSPSAIGVRAMRLVSAAISTAFLASAFTALRKVENGTPLLLGLATAITPMALYLGGAVHPSGVEIAAGTALWASLLALVLGAQPSGRLVGQAAAAAAGLALTRPLSPLWIGAIVLVLTIVAPRGRLRALARNPVVLRGAAVVAVFLALAAAWTLGAHTFGNLIPGTLPLPEASSTDIVRVSVGKYGGQVRQMIGMFGWLDAPPPLLTHAFWLCALGMLILLGLATAPARFVAGLLVLIGLTVLVPVALESAQARSFGYIWQGRYTLPVAAGIPLLGAAMARDTLRRLGGRLVVVLVGLLVTAHFLAFVWALRRYAVGINGWFDDDLVWQPPVPAVALVVAFAATLVAYGWWVVRLARTPVTADGAVPTDASAPER